MFKLDRMRGERGATAIRVQQLARAAVDVQERMDQFGSRRNDPSGMRMRNLVHDRLARVHRKLVARLEVAERKSGSV